jgi:hypothetical protein
MVIIRYSELRDELIDMIPKLSPPRWFVANQKSTYVAPPRMEVSSRKWIPNTDVMS